MKLNEKILQKLDSVVGYTVLLLLFCAVVFGIGELIS